MQGGSVKAKSASASYRLMVYIHVYIHGKTKKLYAYNTNMLIVLFLNISRAYISVVCREATHRWAYGEITGVEASLICIADI